MTYSRAQWSSDFLKAIGNSNPNPQTVAWVVGWSAFETGCCNGASYNLLNTTEPNTPGVVSNFNSVGVKNYATYADGIGANAKVVQNGLYPELARALQTNNLNALANPDSAIQQELGKWGTGWRGWGFQGPGAQDQFGGTASAVPKGTGTTQSGNPLTSPFATSSGIPLVGPLIDWFTGFTNQFVQLTAWLTNPIRILKLVMGIVLLGGALVLLIMPGAEKVVSNVTGEVGKFAKVGAMFA